MTPTALNELMLRVRAVAPACWPDDDLTFEAGWFRYEDLGGDVVDLDTDIAELIFIGAMVKWLAEQYRPDRTALLIYQPVLDIFRCGRLSKSADGPTLIEALAAAVIATKEQA